MNAPYHLITIVIITLFLYVACVVALKVSLISLKTHRRIWNSILLLTFLITSMLGFLLALQVNYKFEVPQLDAWMVFHVDVGIAMAIVSIIHLTWHWNYYMQFFTRTNTKNDIRNKNQTKNFQITRLPQHEVIFSILFLGFQSMVVQTIFIREYLSLFTGNELIIGIVLSFWMVFTGAGSIVAQKTIFPNKTIRWLLRALAVIPLFLFTVMILMRYRVFIPGTEVNLIKSAVYIASFQFPFCLISGMLFPQLIVHLKHKGHEKILGTSYALETVGGIASGFMLGFVLLHLTTNLNILIIGLIIGSFPIVFQKNKVIRKIPVFAVILLTGIILMNSPVEKKIKSAVFINQTIQKIENSVYGEIVQTSQFEQINIYENQHRVFTSENEQEMEEIIHYPLIQLSNPQTILVITSNISQALTELNLYETIERVDFIETNTVLLEQQKQFFPDSTGFQYYIHENDPVWFLNHSGQSYDAAILDFPSPSTLNYNRFYTRSFYQLISEHLNPGGIVVSSLPASMNYLDTGTEKLIGTVYHTMHQVFSNIMLVPGTNLLFLGSNFGLSEDLIGLMEDKNLEADYVNPYYVDLFSIQQHRQQLMDQITTWNEPNTKNNPVAFFYAIESWFGKTGENNKLFLYGIAILLIVLLFAARNKFSISIFFSGFTVSGVEFLVIFLFQMTVGSIYHYISVITSLFMAGLTIGAFWKNQINTKPPLFPYQLIITILLILISITMKFLHHYHFLHTLIYVGLGFLVSLLCGIIFVRSANSIESSTIATAGKAYGFDLFGAALGAFIFPVFIIPFAGFFPSLFIIAVINLIIGITILIRK